MGRGDRLLVEGKDDLHVIAALLMHHEVPDIFKIKATEGFENLIQILPVELKGSEVERLGIVVDADTDLAAHWASVSNVLRASGYNDVPAAPPPDGALYVRENEPVVGVWLMPDNTTTGMLEDFIKFLVPEDDVLWGHAGSSLDAVIDKCEFPAQHRSKAHLHTWLAWQKEPGRPIGQAITHGYLDPEVPQADLLISWIKHLFSLQ